MKSLLQWILVVSCLFSVCVVTVFGDDKKDDADTGHAAPVKEEFLKKLRNALEVTKDTIQKISDEWDIPHYPRFLKSCFMHKSAWETMKWKYMSKILKREISGEPVSFVISFSGR
jgi:hypothetical protein